MRTKSRHSTVIAALALRLPVRAIATINVISDQFVDGNVNPFTIVPEPTVWSIL